jgi:diguanylate cyclase (GGDEF)-like protein
VRIVAVDPSRLVLKSIAQLLAAPGHEVRPFVDGREALDHIKANAEVDVLITSTEPASLSGIELCWEARLLAGCGRPMHIILMSSNRDQEHLVQALDCGADDFIGKPPAAQELFARLRSAERMLSMQRDLIRLATTDPLTGLLNRRAFFERGLKLCARAAGGGGGLAAIMLDIDHFKRINDEYGHDVGDEALRCVAVQVAAKHSVVGRLGGEEFAILLEGAGLAAAIAEAESLRQVFAGLPVETASGRLALTCSFGVGEWMQGDGIDQLMRRADLAMYEAKHGGRNRVVGSHAAMPRHDQAKNGSVIRAVPR